ncbi:MAG: DUF2807 domain-containing protein [Crocinitomicaceae bacterium]|nr:DUF2807 domain-containing protein [Crocinitomicaceae bacterium]
MKNLFAISFLVLIVACKKDTCWNGYGNQIETDYALDKSYDSIYVGKGIEVYLTQDTNNYVEVVSGEKIIQNIEVRESGNTLHISNHNKCHFLRDYEKKTVINIHQESFDFLHFNTENNITFTDTIHTDRILLYQEHGGGEMDIKVNCNFLKIVSYNGSGSFKASGIANVTEITTKVGAFGDARELSSSTLYVTNISKDDLFVNFDNANVTVSIEGTGNIIFRGTPNSMNLLPVLGVGECIPE